ncbi:hypothetical protein LITTLEDOG_38 [Serratia phage vB_SmaS_LittleDog]|uniref:Uncharacterized protein n=1 Tax=Serratia phage vB_SmaS_Bigdog TaxID=2777364 RepID=A0A7T3TL38_9CAUD|nr:hypothetical protein QJS28_gp41 [Serratia phage vB_SmaS_Bigdog]QPX75375.1 hypothetical protein [Serratia phage vB_SmaS_Opt-148]UGO51780.1 hypothetical protein SWAIN_38 [Serratia phage vB_SmaS_Swain]UGO51844.1 hypothetical protein CARROT_38 [Serratia phage vB_SmaS_Carrot]UGO53062.1 hypothetical protein LITTLEDOG_38 [Serratia phage vB_SmaS_LittleDog]QPX75145.1 hypothetical protein BIGDOG_41 [Serratia phage vB_SmaS_Bigdog]
MITIPMKLSSLQAGLVSWLASRRNELKGVVVSHNPPGVQFASEKQLKLFTACIAWDYQVDALLMAFISGKVGKVKYENLIGETNEMIDRLKMQK